MYVYAGGGNALEIIAYILKPLSLLIKGSLVKGAGVALVVNALMNGKCISLWPSLNHR